MAAGIAGIQLQASSVVPGCANAIAGIHLKTTQLKMQISSVRRQLQRKCVFRKRFRTALLFRQVAAQRSVVLRVLGRKPDSFPQLLFGAIAFAGIRQQASQVSPENEISRRQTGGMLHRRRS